MSADARKEAMRKPKTRETPLEIERVFQDIMARDAEVSDADLKKVFEWSAPMLSAEQRKDLIWKIMEEGCRALRNLDIH